MGRGSHKTVQVHKHAASLLKASDQGKELIDVAEIPNIYSETMDGECRQPGGVCEEIAEIQCICKDLPSVVE